jgi:ATP-dependent DNA helicase DinG
MLALDVIEQVPILPDHNVVVIDEAHELVDQTTKALSGELNVIAIERAAGLIRKFISSATHSRMLEVADDLGRTP